MHQSHIILNTHTTMKNLKLASDTNSKKRTRPGNNMEYEMRMRTWNVRTLLRSGALKELREIITSYDADVIALQELRWKGSGILRGREDEADLYYSCQQNRHNNWMEPGVRKIVFHQNQRQALQLQSHICSYSHR